MIFFILYVISFFDIVWGGNLSCDYDQQPENFKSLHLQWKYATKDCIFQKNSNDFQISNPSYINTQFKHSIPNNQGWTRCLNCIWSNSSIYYFASSAVDSPIIDASWNQWEEFFFEHHNDRYQLYPIEKLSFQYIINHPVYICPIITFHVGHILIDVIESIYHSMVASYGMIRTDALIVFDVAGDDERKILQEKLTRNIAGEYDVLGQILRLFSSNPIISVHFLQSAAHNILLKDLHIGLDISHSFYSISAEYHPLNIDISSDRFLQAASKYQMFREYLIESKFLQFLQKESCISNNNNSSDEIESINVLIIQRANSRVIMNVDIVIDLICNKTVHEVYVNCLMVELEDIRFSSQLSLFGETDILISVAGTALHNIIFFRPKTKVIVLMQRQWCKWSWIYTNQATLLGMATYIYCEDNISNDQSSPTFVQWTKGYWNQGPRFSKFTNISLEMSRFLPLFEDALLSCITNKVTISTDKDAKAISFKVKNEEEITSQSFVWSLFEISSYNVSLFMNTIEIKHIDESSNCEVHMMGELEFDSIDGMTFIGTAMPHLAVCISFPRQALNDTICIPIHKFNYYANLILKLDCQKKQVYGIHMWLQSSSTSSFGKIKGSDSYFTLDTSRDDGGIRIINIININFSFNSIKFSPNHIYSIQKEIKLICMQRLFSTVMCLEFIEDLYTYMKKLFLIQELKLPSIQYIPSNYNPFIFLHIEKTAGTTLREFIAESADKLHLDYFIPCHGNISCLTFDIHSKKPLTNLSVIAGHFSWDSWKLLPSVESQIFQPSCFVMGRHPIERTISYYYHRCFPVPACVGYNRMLNTLSKDEFEYYVYHHRDGRYLEDNKTIIITDEGLSNAACRALANKKVTSGTIISNNLIKVPDSLSMNDISTAISNVQQCIVGLMENYNQTLSVMKLWFPWIDFSNDTTRHKMKLVTGKETYQTLRLDLRKIIIEANYGDMLLYQSMEELFDKQKLIIAM